MVGWIILLLLLGLLLWLLLAPMVLIIDTKKNQYEVRVLGILRTWPSIEDNEFILHFKVPFYDYRLKPMDLERKGDEAKAIEEKAREKANKVERKQKRKKKRSIPVRRILNVIRSFQVRDFEVHFDTDNYMVNAQLYPVCQWLQLRQVNVHVNFKGDNALRLEIRNTVLRMLVAFLAGKNYPLKIMSH